MILQKTKISAIIDKITLPAHSNDLTLKLSIPDESGTINEHTVVTPAEMKIFLLKYFDWCFLSINENPFYDFLDYFENFKNQNLSNFERVFIALNEKYNPLHNYDKNSEITTESNAYTDTTTRDGFTDTQHNPVIRTTNSGGETVNKIETSPFENDNFYNKDKNTVTVPQTYTETGAHDVGVEHGEQKDTVEHGGQKTTVTEKTFGNIGVTTSMKMLTEEKDGRKENMFDYVMNLFVKQYLFMIDTF